MTTLTYLFDPLCGWCYGASNILADLATRPDTILRLMPTGLFSGDGARMMDETFADYAWSNDQRIAKLTGQVFSDDYRSKVLQGNHHLFDSGPATLALTAVALEFPNREREALKSIQMARYVNGQDITDIAVLSNVLRTAGFNEAAVRLESPDADLLDANQHRIENARHLMHQFKVDGVPVLIVGEGANARVIKTNILFGNIEHLAEQLQ